MLKPIILALTLTTAIVSPANAMPAITAGIFGATFAGSLGGLAVSALLTVGAQFAVSSIFGLFNQDTAGSATQERQITPGRVQYGDRVPHNGIAGIAHIAGHKVHYNEYSNATKAQLVYILASAWCEGLEAVKINGRQHSLVSKTVSGTEHKRYWVDGYDDLIDIRFHDGRPGQAADTELVAQTSGWDSNKKYSGHCYVAVTLTSDRDKFNGIPEISWVVKGQRWYDRRKDTTAGGSGSHRFDDPTTWEYTANNFVIADHYTRGYYFNSNRILGAGLSISDIDATTTIAAMNVADQTVTKPDATTRNRYEFHGVFYDTDKPADFLNRLCVAGGGFFAEKAGQIAFFAGASQSSVATITDDDLVVDEPVKFSPKMPGALLYTGIQGTYTRSDDDLPAPYSGIESSTSVTNDGGRARTEQFNLDDVRDPHQAFMVARQKFYLGRLQATESITLDIKDVLIEVGDWIDRESSNTLRGDRTYRVEGSSLDLKRARMHLSLREISSDVFDDDAVLSDIEEPTRAPGVFGYLTTASNVSCSGASLAGSDGSVLPALGFAYDGIADAAVAAVLFQYRIKSGPGVIVVDRDDSPGDGAYYTSKGVAASELYEFRHKLDTLPGRAVDWSDWIDASTSTPEPEIADDSIGFNKLKAAVNSVRQETAKAIDDLNEYLAELASTNAGLDISTKEEIQAKAGGIAALVVQEAQARADADGSLASSVTAVVAQYDDVSATGLFSMVSETAPDGYSVKITIGARLTDGGDVSTAGLSILLDSEGNSALDLDFDVTLCRGIQQSTNGVMSKNWDRGDESTITPDA